jgi:hypothetical protein
MSTQPEPLDAGGLGGGVITRHLCRGRRLVVRRDRRVERSGFVQRVAGREQRPRLVGVTVRDQLRGPHEKAGRGPHVAAPARTLSRGRKSSRRLFADIERVLVERAELTPVPVGLLEVIPLDLFELVGACADVDGVGPRHEPLVQDRPVSLSSPL